jgi:Flp pilus assembly pilin Flp
VGASLIDYAILAALITVVVVEVAVAGFLDSEHMDALAAIAGQELRGRCASCCGPRLLFF